MWVWAHGATVRRGLLQFSPTARSPHGEPEERSEVSPSRRGESERERDREIDIYIYRES
jgi:hypothetical protein